MRPRHRRDSSCQHRCCLIISLMLEFFPMFCEPAKKKSKYKNKYLHRRKPKWDGFCMFSSRGMCMTQIPSFKIAIQIFIRSWKRISDVHRSATDLTVEGSLKFKGSAFATRILVENGLLLDGSGGAISGELQVVFFDESVDGGGQEAWTRWGDCWGLRVAEQGRWTG